MIMRSTQESDGKKKRVEEGHGNGDRSYSSDVEATELARPPARSAAICAALQPTLGHGHGHGRAFLSWLGLASCLWKARAASAPSPSHYKEALYFPRRFCLLFCCAPAVVSHLRPPWPGDPRHGFSSSSSGGGSATSTAARAARAAVRAGRPGSSSARRRRRPARGGGGTERLYLLPTRSAPIECPVETLPPPETPIDLGLCGTPN